MRTLRVFFTLLGRLWRTGNFWLRIALVILGTGFILIPTVALVGYPALTAGFTLVVFLAGVISFFTFFDPMIVAVLAAFNGADLFGRHIPGTRRGMRWLATVVSIELGLGVYCSVVPVHKDPGLLLIALLGAVTLFFLSIGVEGRGRKWGTTLIVLVLLGATTIFVLGGRDAVVNRIETGVVSPTAPPTTSVHEITKTAWKMVVIPVNHVGHFGADVDILVRPGASGAIIRIEPSGKMWEERTGEEVKRIGESVSNTYYLRLPPDHCGSESAQVGLTTYLP